MEKLIEKLTSCEAALATLSESLAMPVTVIVRDACIQRFEYSFESLWKLLKAYLEYNEGIVCNSPKSCFREALQVQLLSLAEAAACLAMTDDRNKTAHLYLEQLAKDIYAKLPAHLSVMHDLAARIRERLGMKDENEKGN